MKSFLEFTVIKEEADEALTNHYVTHLNKNLGTKEFSQITSTMHKLGHEQVNAIHHAFMGFKGPGSRKGAIKKMDARNQNLLVSKAKLAATGGRIAG